MDRSEQADIEGLVEKGEDAVGEIDGVGEAIAAKIVEYVETGSIAELDDLRAELPVDMAALTSVEGIGPKTVGDLYDGLGVETLDDLEAAAEAGEIQTLKGYGEKTEQNILENLEFARESHGRTLLGDARPQGEAVRSYLGDLPAVDACELAGSLRRWRPTIGDVDVLVASDDPEAVFDALTDWEDTDDVIEAGTAKASVRSRGFRVDLRVVAPAEFGAAIQYFTGSKDHNVALRNRAIDRDLKMNEYGVFDVSGVDDDSDQRAGRRVGGETEAEMYDALDLPWIPPELREDRGEIQAAAEGSLPDLLTEDDLRGDLHLHTEWSDGTQSIADLVSAAESYGHEYVCITDHATGPGVVGGMGLSDADLREQLAEIKKVAEDAPIDVLAGVEANIAADGSISVGDDVLAELDLVVASPHSALSGEATERLCTAIEHPEVDVLGHPHGRYIMDREGLDLDLETVAETAAEHDTALEVNSNPKRLDLGGSAVKTAVDAGATIAINTDAHAPQSFAYQRYGVHTARRGWAEATDVLNARNAGDVRDFCE
jgi:DNA polymerase (family 10)